MKRVGRKKSAPQQLEVIIKARPFPDSYGAGLRQPFVLCVGSLQLESSSCPASLPVPLTSSEELFHNSSKTVPAQSEFALGIRYLKKHW